MLLVHIMVRLYMQQPAMSKADVGRGCSRKQRVRSRDKGRNRKGNPQRLSDTGQTLDECTRSRTYHNVWGTAAARDVRRWRAVGRERERERPAAASTFPLSLPCPYPSPLKRSSLALQTAKYHRMDVQQRRRRDSRRGSLITCGKDRDDG
jgi:hypothetical protein